MYTTFILLWWVLKRLIMCLFKTTYQNIAIEISIMNAWHTKVSDTKLDTEIYIIKVTCQ